jgi:hypothetical protein
MCICLTTSEPQIILKELPEGVARGHFVVDIIAKKILDVRYWWPTLFKDIHDFCKSCDNCQKIRGFKNKKSNQVRDNISRITFYEVGSRFYRSNRISKKTNRK